MFSESLLHFVVSKIRVLHCVAVSEQRCRIEQSGRKECRASAQGTSVPAVQIHVCSVERKWIGWFAGMLIRPGSLAPAFSCA